MTQQHDRRSYRLEARLRAPWVTAALVAAAATAPAAPGGPPPGPRSCATAVVDVILREGDPAPGSGAAFQVFDRPNVSAAGQVLFTGDTDGPTDADDVIYVGTTLLAREGDAAAGAPGTSFAVFETFESAHQISLGGDAVFIATLRDAPAASDRAVYRNGALIAREGDAPAGIPDRVFGDFGFAGVADDATVGFLADLTGSTSDDSAIFYGALVLYREGDPVPGLDGEVWDANFDEVQWNGRGDVLFEGNTSLPSAGDTVLFRRLNDPELGPVESVVAQEGQAVDAWSGPDTLGTIVQTALAENGLWAMRGALTNAPSDADAIILSETGFSAQEGEPVPDLPGVEIGEFTAVSINSLGDVVYLADLEGATPPDVDEGIFVNGCLLLTDGTPAPGLPDGTILSDLGFEDVYINDQRMVVFAAGYTGAASGDGLFSFTVEVASPCPADLDGSGDVGFTDLLVFLAAWGPCPVPGPCPADLDGSGGVGAADLAVLLGAWGGCD